MTEIKGRSVIPLGTIPLHRIFSYECPLDQRIEVTKFLGNPFLNPTLIPYEFQDELKSYLI
jgi:hypothetical protein